MSEVFRGSMLLGFAKYIPGHLNKGPNQLISGYKMDINEMKCFRFHIINELHLIVMFLAIYDNYFKLISIGLSP